MSVIAFEICNVQTAEIEREYAITLEMHEVTVITAGEQGPPGRDGLGALQISQLSFNRLEAKPDGLYVSDNLTPDPLAYYILAKG